MILLLRLITAHLITDFLLQSKTWINDRRLNKYKSKYLYLHGLITGLGAYIFLGRWDNFQVPLFIMTTHTLIDLWKSYQKANTTYFILDQFFHLVILLLSALYLSEKNPEMVKYFSALMASTSFWATLIGYITIIWPMSYLIAFATEKWHEDMQNKGLKDAGKIIGQIERVLILTFVLLGRYEAIGFLIAAKSIFRFSEVQKERKEAEYILTGTLMSFAVSVFIGIGVKAIISGF